MSQVTKHRGEHAARFQGGRVGSFAFIPKPGAPPEGACRLPLGQVPRARRGTSSLGCSARARRSLEMPHTTWNSLSFSFFKQSPNDPGAGGGCLSKEEKWPCPGPRGLVGGAAWARAHTLFPVLTVQLRWTGRRTEGILPPTPGCGRCCPRGAGSCCADGEQVPERRVVSRGLGGRGVCRGCSLSLMLSCPRLCVLDDLKRADGDLLREVTPGGWSGGAQAAQGSCFCSLRRSGRSLPLLSVKPGCAPHSFRPWAPGPFLSGDRVNEKRRSGPDRG